MTTPTDRVQILRAVEDSDSDRLARIALAMIPATGDRPGNPPPGEAEYTLRQLLDRQPNCLDAERFRTIVAATTEQNLDVIIPGDERWPMNLSELGEAQPIVLWARGNTGLLTRPLTNRIVVTGSRAASHYGERVAHDIAHDLASHGYTITTGGEFGIGAAALRAAVGGNAASIAVLPSALDRPHPHLHGPLFDSVVGSGGLLLTEAPPGVRATRAAVARRGRIMAALAGTTVVVEAAARSGVLPIAQQAIALWRLVGAVPGPITNATSAGCHQLIQDGDTHLITSADDIINLIDNPKT